MIPQKWILVFLIGVISQVESGPEEFRLPDNVIPNHYRIKILTDLSDDFFYNGEVCIDFLAKAPTNKIVLHSKNLKIFENETKLEEFGKIMSPMNEQSLRKPKEFSWGAAEFRNRPKAELQEAEFRDEIEENERVLATERKKPDVVFDRQEVFEKQSDESSSSSSSESVETSDEIHDAIKSIYKPLPSKDDIHQENMKGTSKEKVTLSSIKPQTDRMKPTTENSNGKPSTEEYSKYPHEYTTMDDKTRPPTKYQTDRMKYTTTEESKYSTDEYNMHTTTDDKTRYPNKNQNDRMKYTTTERMKYTTEEYNSMHTTHDKTRYPVQNQKYTTTDRTKYSTDEYNMHTTTNDKTRYPIKNQNDRMKYTTTERMKYSTEEYNSMHTTDDKTRYPVQNQKYTTTDRTKYSTTEYDSMHATDDKYPVKNQNDRMKYTTTERMKYSTNEYNPMHTTEDKTRYPVKNENDKMKYTTTERMKYSTEEYNFMQTTDEKPQHPVQNENDRMKYTTTDRTKYSTHKYTKSPQESLHTTRQPSKTQTDRYTTTDVTYNEMSEHPTTEHIKHQSTTHHTTMDDRIHFTHPTMMTDQQHSTTPKRENTKSPPVENEEPFFQQSTTQESVMTPMMESHHMEETSVKIPENSFSVLKHEFDTRNEFLVVHLDKPLIPGKKYKLFLTYQGVLTDTLTGFHRVPYVKRGSSKSTWLASTVFEPNEARTAFPCFDEPAFKATFDVTLGHDKKFTALSNMPLKSKTPIEGKPDWQWSEFETSPPMSTYTVAFLISDLEYLTPRVNYTASSPNVTYRFWSRPDVLYKTRYAMRIAPEMKNYLESVLGVRDVLPKHDFVALPNFISSALENWGLYSFAEKNLLFTPGFSSIFSKFEITHVVGHEIAHLWFGNMVTPRWWDQIWLSEGFANFFEIIAADHVQPTWDLKTVSVIFSYLKVFTYDALHSSHPLVPRLQHPNDLNEIFDSITYQKGFYLVRMLNYTLGQEAFMNGVRRYLKENMLSTVDENVLWDILTESAHQENTLPAEYHLKDIMHAWTRRTGYPIIDVVRDYDNHTANITQRRFVRSKNDYEFRDNSLDEDEGETKWWIPLTYTTGSELNFRDFKPRVWLNPQADYHVLTDMPSKSDFVLMNLDAAGLYRVNYDERNWALIISYLINENSSDISVVNRVQILDDLLDLARAGEISYERALDATSYLAKEKHFLPWKAALSNFDFISRMLRLTDSNKSFKRYVRNMVTPRFEELGFESTRNEPLSDGLNRKQIAKWACKTGVRQCTRKSISLFKKWTEEKKPDEHNPIPSNLRSIVYCTAIENGGSKDWQFLWQRYLSNVVTDKSAILYGLGCSKSTRTLRKYLDWSIKETSGIKKQDTPTVFKSVVRNDIGFNLAKTFLKERMGDIKSYLGNNPFYLPQMIESVAAKMNEPADLEQLEELEQAHFSHLRSVPRSFRQAAERVRFNINWLERNFKPIHDWLKKQRV